MTADSLFDAVYRFAKRSDDAIWFSLLRRVGLYAPKLKVDEREREWKNEAD